MNPLHHSDAGSGRETAIFVAVAVAALLEWGFDAWSKVRCRRSRSGIGGLARTYIDALPMLGFLVLVFSVTNGFGGLNPTTAAVGGLASIILLVVIGGAAGLVLEGSSGEEMELR